MKGPKSLLQFMFAYAVQSGYINEERLRLDKVGIYKIVIFV